MGTVKQSTTTTDVIEVLTAQHEEVDQLFEKLSNEQGDTSAVFAELADKLAAHATIEEKLFYPSVMAKQTSEILYQAVEEHLEVKRILADLLAMRVGHEAWKAKIEVLKENVSHHAHEEEEPKLFPIVRKLMTADERAALGNECLAMFEQILTMHPAKDVPSETVAAAPLPQPM